MLLRIRRTMRRLVVSRRAMPPLPTKPATLTLLMCCAVLKMGMFMPNLLVLLMSTLNGLFGFLIPLLLTSKDPLQNGYLKPSIDLLQVFASGGGSWLLDSGATNHMTGSKDLVVDVQRIPSMPTHVQFGDASYIKVLGLDKVVISHDLTIEKVMLVESLAYNLNSWALPHSLILIPWPSCGARLLK